MAYSSRYGKRPMEYASKSSHQHIIKDENVQRLLKDCVLPKPIEEEDINKCEQFKLEEIEKNPIKYVIAIDGGSTSVEVKKEYPSSQVGFFQFGPLMFKLEHLDEVAKKPFIDPEDMRKFKEIERHTLTLPMKNIKYKDEATFLDSVRRVIYDFLCEGDEKFIDTLKWLIYEEFSTGKDSWNLSRCPNTNCDKRNFPLKRSDISDEYTFKCPECDKKIYLSDIFRFHEVIDEELGAGGIKSYLLTALEQIVLIHWIRNIINTAPSLLKEALFIKDGPLSFFGQTAKLRRPMRELIKFLMKEHDIFLAGLEKSGAFVEHAHEISNKLKPGTVMLLDNEYIYKFILPTGRSTEEAYGRSTYYGNKVIFKTFEGGVYVVTLPTKEELVKPKKKDYKNIDVILNNIQKLKCDMYDDSLFPIALANKLVSLSYYPSSKILERFAQEGVNND